MTCSLTTNDRGDYVASDNDMPFMAYLNLNPALYAIGFDAVEFPRGKAIVYEFGKLPCATCGFESRAIFESGGKPFCSDGCMTAWDRETERIEARTMQMSTGQWAPYWTCDNAACGCDLYMHVTECPYCGRPRPEVVR